MELEKGTFAVQKYRSETYGGKCVDEICDRKNALTPSEKRELMVYSGSEHGISTRNSCKLFIINRSVFYYKKKKNNEDEMIKI